MKKISSVSVVIPAYNEEENIRTLVEATVEALESISTNFEIILVDDGSEDNTFSIIEQLSRVEENIIVCRHLKRRGKSMALRSGFTKAKSEAIVTMDADLQYDPWEIPRLLNLLTKGYDVVNGYRDFSKYVLSKTIVSKLYNQISTRLLGSREVHDCNCGLKAFRKKVVKHLLREIVWRRGIHRYLIALCTTLGYKVTEARVSLKQRVHGCSKYGLKRIIDGISLLLILFVEMRLLNLRNHV